jgi:uncharacterized membrane protein
MAPRPHLPGRVAGHHRLGVLIALLVLVALIGVAVYVAVRLANRRPGHRAAAVGAYGPTALPPMAYGRDPALEHARLRYARGELSRDDYLRVVGDLGGDAPPPPPAPSG